MKRYFLVLALISTSAAAEPPTANINVANIFDGDRHVVLMVQDNSGTSCFDEKAYHRVQLDGSVKPGEFVVPAGHTLLVTDASFETQYGPIPFNIGQGAHYVLVSQNPDGSNVVFLYRTDQILVTAANQLSRFIQTARIHGGVPVGEGRVLCAGSSANTQAGGTNARVRVGSTAIGTLLPNQ